jgi:hypothetical protein
MEGQVVSWLISLVTGGVGGNVAGALFKNLSLGTVGNTLAGGSGRRSGWPTIGSSIGYERSKRHLGQRSGVRGRQHRPDGGRRVHQDWLAEK